ncbi:hypothetical protein VCSRO100_3508 [Vibrio cholerae]|nr:hypothetical protein VCSRO100_3508 [Vibrio cholerae]
MKILCKNIIEKIQLWHVGKPIYFPDLGGYYDEPYQLRTAEVVYMRHWTSKVFRKLISWVKANPFEFCMRVVNFVSVFTWSRT